MSSETLKPCPTMPDCDDREPFGKLPGCDEPLDYLESNRDWADRNDEVVDWLADNHAAIRAALESHIPDPKVQALVDAVDGLDDDYMTSENHHPDYVLIPQAKFSSIVMALAAFKDTQP